MTSPTSTPGYGPGSAAPAHLITHRSPATCPVCSTSLITLRLGCPSCGTELSGHFDSCRYCRLDAADSQILAVFLRGRGNVRDVQAHLGVSYPTARTRLSEVLDRLGFGEESTTPGAGGSAAGARAGADATVGGVAISAASGGSAATGSTATGGATSGAREEAATAGASPSGAASATGAAHVRASGSGSLGTQSFDTGSFDTGAAGAATGRTPQPAPRVSEEELARVLAELASGRLTVEEAEHLLQ